MNTLWHFAFRRDLLDSLSLFTLSSAFKSAAQFEMCCHFQRHVSIRCAIVHAGTVLLVTHVAKIVSTRFVHRGPAYIF